MGGLFIQGVSIRTDAVRLDGESRVLTPFTDRPPPFTDARDLP